MMSLFSSFDLGIFNSMIFVFLVFFSMGVYKILWMSSYFSRMNLILSCSLLSFFNSLSNSNFSKGLSFNILLTFFFISVLNSFSIFSFIFPLSSQMSMVLGFSFLFWASFVIISFLFNFKSQISHFIPEGAPLGLSFVLFLIEVVSILIRPITLSIRLVANILAGHLLVILLTLLVQSFGFLIPFLSVLNMVEILVSFIQAYILATLISLYYSEL